MARLVTGWMLVIYTLAANRLFGADGNRFSDQAETAIGVFVGNREISSRLWSGRTEVVESGLHRAVHTTAIYLPGSKLLWWALSYTSPSPTAQTLQKFKQYFRCVAEPSAIVCFTADSWHVYSIRSGEKVDNTDIASLVSQRFAHLDADAIQRKLREGETIYLGPIAGLASLYAPPHGGSDTGLGALYYITKAVPNQNGWELDIQNSVNGRVGSVRLDTAMRPISGKMIK